MRVVLDSNIILSGIVYPSSAPWKILDIAKDGSFKFCFSQFIILEVKRNLTRKFGYSEKIAERAISELIENGIILEPKETIKTIKADDSDNRILECALAAKADYLVTGDKKHILPLGKIDGCKIVSAKEFLKIVK